MCVVKGLCGLGFGGDVFLDSWYFEVECVVGLCVCCRCRSVCVHQWIFDV